MLSNENETTATPETRTFENAWEAIDYGPGSPVHRIYMAEALAYTLQQALQHFRDDSCTVPDFCSLDETVQILMGFLDTAVGEMEGKLKGIGKFAEA